MRRIILLVAFLVVACNADPNTAATAESTTPPESTTTTTEATTTTTVPDTFSDVEEMRERLEEAGIECDAWRIREDADYAAESADCQEDMVLSIHTDSAQVATQMSVSADLLGTFGFDTEYVYGENWTANCSGSVCEEIQETLGGDIERREAPATSTTVPARELQPSDFSIDLIVLESQCFNTAGATVTVEPDFTIHRGEALEILQQGEYVIIYEVNGGEAVNTYNIETDGENYSYEEHRISTASCDYELTAEITRVMSR